MTTETCTFGGGCFWCLDSAFRRVKGVQSVASGYAAGEMDNPTYEAVCHGTTGHAEVIQITFDSEQISFEQLLAFFFAIHDPTTLNRQGADVGTQYRSIILYHNDAQKQTAERVMKTLDANNTWSDPIVTQLEPFEMFYEAEEYHQDYFNRNPGNGYCQMVISPKLAKMVEKFPELVE